MNCREKLRVVRAQDGPGSDQKLLAVFHTELRALFCFLLNYTILPLDSRDENLTAFGALLFVNRSLNWHSSHSFFLAELRKHSLRGLFQLHQKPLITVLN